MRGLGIVLVIVGVLLVAIGLLQHVAHLSMVTVPHENVGLGLVGVVVAVIGALVLRQGPRPALR